MSRIFWRVLVVALLLGTAVAPATEAAGARMDDNGGLGSLFGP
jgi:hypothetical protein